MYCAHCRKLITEDNHKFLNDLLSTYRSDINTGHVQSAVEVTILDALARVVGVRLLAKDKFKSLPEKFCICESCEQLLQKLYAAHECFWDDNSLIVKSFDLYPISDARIEKSTQTDFDLTEDIIEPSSSGGVVTSLDSVSNDDFEDDRLDNEGSETEGHPEPVHSHSSSDTFSILKTLGILNDVTQFPFVKIESSVRRLADLKMKSGSHRSACDPDYAISTAVSNENVEFFNQMSLSNAVINTSESEKMRTPTTIKIETDVECRTLRRKTVINYNEIGEANGWTDEVVPAGFDRDPEDEVYFPAVEDGKPEEENYAEGEDLNTYTPTKMESPSTRLKSNSKAKEFHCKFPECAKRMFTHRGLNAHEIIVHGKPKLDPKEKHRRRRERGYHCKFNGCGKSFTSSFNLKSHAETHLPEEERQRLEKRFQCEECGKSFLRPDSLLRHRKNHLPPQLKKFKCNEPGCSKAFREGYKLKKHKITHIPIDRRNRMYPCQICEKRFSTPYEKSIHMTVHSEARNYLCTLCGKAFKAMQKLGVHMKSHTNEGLRLHKCKECGKGFQDSTRLKIHATVHRGKLSEICEVCGKGFKSIKNLMYHMVQHKNQRQHKCPAKSCTTGFNYKHHLRQHLEGVHSLDPQKVNRFLKNPQSENLFD